MGIGYQGVPAYDCIICGKICYPSTRRVSSRRCCGNCYVAGQRSGVLPPLWEGAQAAAFWARVDKTGDCWHWKGTRNEYGYGIFLLPGEKGVRAHRFAFTDVVGPIPKGKVLMHSCDNPGCVNPAHLTPGTRGENNRDSKRKGRNAKGETNGRSRLRAQDVIAIRHDERTQMEIAAHYGITMSHVSRIKSREVWDHLP